MEVRYPPINPKCPHFLHGGDYNPDQWMTTPEIWDEDMRLMGLAGCNAMSVGIFSWTALEPAEGSFTFDWLDAIMDKLADNGAFAVLATPSGARPAWMSAAYPEVLRVDANRVRILHGARHNHCYTSPVYREKVGIINTKLAERYRGHPALLVWHLSNEYGGECHCDLCREAFRVWLRDRYHDDLDALNAAWWAGFWSHTFTDWSQIEPPSPRGETSMQGLSLDWKRFVTYQTTDFMKDEMEPLRRITPDVPCTTNFMGTYAGLDYWRMARELDVISWDSYPRWHSGDDVRLACGVAFTHDLNRSMKDGRPFMLIESTPSTTNWMAASKRKRPGMHLLSSLQAVAHGSDTVQYFQWRKGRGGSEKFHGAVVDHVGHENTRVFRDVAEVGTALRKLGPVIGSTMRPDVAVIFDWENRWATEGSGGPRNIGLHYHETVVDHYRPFWRRGVPVDVIEETCDFARYRLLVAPMMYLVKPRVAERVEAFVEAGGTFVATYWTGIVDEHDLCFLGGFPGPLRTVLGIWDEEIDALTDDDRNSVVPADDNGLGLSDEYEARHLCALVHAETAEVLATFGQDFYAGRPALTANRHGAGRAYYIASRNDDRFLSDFTGALIRDLRLSGAVGSCPPEGVSVQVRSDGRRRFIFLMNFTTGEQEVVLDRGEFTDLLSGENAAGRVTLGPYGVTVLEDGVGSA